MRKLIGIISNNKLISGSLIMFIGVMAGNVSSYLYHLLMGRMLGPVDYGTLTALISLFYIIGIPTYALGTTVVKFTSSAKAKGDYAGVYSLFFQLSQKFLIISVGVFLLFIFISRPIADFLQIHNQNLVILAGSLFFVGFLPTINNGILQAFLNFSFLTANSILGAILKIILAAALVFLGFSVGGAVTAILISTLIMYLLSFYPLRSLLKIRNKSVNIDWSKIIFYTGPAFLTVSGLVSLYTTDIILVKHFFPAEAAGLYAALAVMGKIIFFASSTIPVVMFPLVSEKYENGESYKPLLLQSLGLTFIISAGLTIFYFLFPRLMINLLYGSSYLNISSYMGIFAIFISLYCLANILINFFLSIRKTRVAIFVLPAAVAQIILIWFFHASMSQVIYNSIFVTALLLVLLLVYYFRNEKG